MPRHALIEDAAPSGPGTVQLALRHCPIEVKRSLALAAVNQGLSLRAVHLEALERYLGLEREVAELESDDVSHPTTREVDVN